MVRFGPFRFNTKDVVSVPKVYYDMFLGNFENQLKVDDFNPSIDQLTGLNEKFSLNKIASVLLETATKA